jgi:NodT family efflux transporter outer membrane factor (OMF) lipoprotein
MRSFALALLAVTACSVGPDFVKPKVSVNATWSESGDPRLQQSAVDAAWWKSLADPTLDQLIDLSYRQNLSLQIAAFRIAEARAQYGIAGANRWPEGGPSARATAVRTSKYSPNSLAIADRAFGDYQVGFDAFWELDFWGKYRRDERAAHAQYLATIADYQNALVSLNAEVARTYVEIRMYEVLIEQTRANEVVQQEALDIAEARFRNGATSELDVAQAKHLLEDTRASIPGLLLGWQRGHNALSTLLGRPTGFVRDLIAKPTGIPVPPAKVAISVPAEMLRRRPDIRGAELRAMAQSERIGVAKADLYPRFTLFGFIGTQASSHTPNSTIKDLFGPGSLVYNAGGSLLWPLLNYKRIRNNVRVEEARFQQAIVEYANTVLRAAQEVEDGIAGYLREQDATVFAQNAVEAASHAVKVAMVQYREGAVDYQRVLDTQRALLESQNQLAEMRSRAVTNLIALYKALGGGWEVRQPQPRGK